MHTESNLLIRIPRTVDIVVMASLAAGEREADQFRQLISKSDHRLSIKNFIKPRGAINSIIEVELQG